MRQNRSMVRASLAALLALAAGAASRAEAPPAVGQAAPPLIVPQLDGRLFDLAALRGQVVIVNFWATWCSPCRAEMPRLDAFYRHYHARGLQLLGVSVDERNDLGTVQKVMKSFGYPAALAADARRNGFGPPVAVPMTWIIDTRGTIRERLIAGNAVTEQSLERSVLPLLPPPRAAAPR
jgi:peroxiredoxin